MIVTKMHASFKKIARKIKLRKVLRYHGDGACPQEAEALANLINDGIRMIPYEFTKKYKQDKSVIRDLNGHPYVNYKGLELFFPRGLSDDAVKTKFNSLLCEQDENSPHRYFSEGFEPGPQDWFYDIGSAEAIIASSVVDVVERVFIFEFSKDWALPLQKTFKNFKDKVTIINKFVTDKTSNETVSISDYVSENHNNYFFKLDVEGEEMNVLRGMADVLDLNINMNLAVCTYHNGGDYEEIVNYLTKKGFSFSHSRGFMLFDLNSPPYLRRGVVRATKTMKV